MTASASRATGAPNAFASGAATMYGSSGYVSNVGIPADHP